MPIADRTKLVLLSK